MRYLHLIISCRDLIPLLVFLFSCSVQAKTIIVSNNAKLENQFVFTKSKYIISDSINLNGQIIDIPVNSSLIFKGKGCLLNGTIAGNLTTIIAQRKCIFQNIKIQGSWCHKFVYGDWVGLKEKNVDNLQEFRALTALCKGPKLTHLYIGSGTFATSAVDGSAPIVLPSNTYWHNDATIQLLPCNFSKYSLVLVSKVNNVKIDGGIFLGDIEGHKSDIGEWGHGIKLGGATNVTLKNITCLKFWGDGIDIIEGIDDSGEATINCDRIVIDHVKCLYNRRQGLSLEAGSNIKIRNSEFAYTGSISYTAPGSGLVIEPWCNNRDKIWSVVIDKCNIHDNKGSDIVCLPNWLKKDNYYKLVNNIVVSNSVVGRMRIFNTNRITIQKTNISFLNVHHTKDIIVEKSHVGKFQNDGVVNGLKFSNCSGDTKSKSFSMLLSIYGAVSTIVTFGFYRYYSHIA